MRTGLGRSGIRSKSDIATKALVGFAPPQACIDIPITCSVDMMAGSELTFAKTTDRGWLGVTPRS